MRRRLPRGLQLAATAALATAALLFGLALWSAVRIAPLPSVTPSARDGTLTLAGTSRDATAETPASSPALANDPFSPGRRLRAEPSVTTTVSRAATPVIEPTPVRLLGTVMRGGSGFAVCQLASDPPRTVRVGETLGELTLITLDQGRAVFRSANGTRVELSLTPPGT
jgi:hypothetical protein